jgi:hypothetical protein
VKTKRILRFVVAVKDLGGKVETVRPDDCAGFEIDAYGGEEVGIIEAPDQGALSLYWCVLDVTHDAIVKEQTHHMRSQDGDAYDRGR